MVTVPPTFVLSTVVLGNVGCFALLPVCYDWLRVTGEQEARKELYQNGSFVIRTGFLFTHTAAEHLRAPLDIWHPPDMTMEIKLQRDSPVRSSVAVASIVKNMDISTELRLKSSTWTPPERSDTSCKHIQRRICIRRNTFFWHFKSTTTVSTGSEARDLIFELAKEVLRIFLQRLE